MDNALVDPSAAMEAIEYWRENPEVFYIDILQCQPWEKQVQILKSVFKNRETAVKSCHGSGKSWNAARIAATFLITHPGAIVITTAPTWRQVKDVLWRELRAAYEQANIPLGGRMSQVGWELSADWYAIGLSTNTPDKFVGYHADHILVIVDEAAGVEEPIFEGIRGVTTNENAHILYIGNPTTLDGTFNKSFRNPLVTKFTISVFDTPNFTHNGIRNADDLRRIYDPPPGMTQEEWIPLRPKLPLPRPELVSPLWAYERLLEWGEDSPMWAARVMGEFPDQADNNLIPYNLIEQSMDPEYRKEHGWVIPFGPPRYGGDIARFGQDRTVIADARGNSIEKLYAYAKQATTETTGRIRNIVDPYDWDARVHIDDIGVGGGVTDQLNAIKSENHEHYSIWGVNVSLPSNYPDKFVNLRAEAYWRLRQQFNDRAIALPNDPELLAELAGIRYFFDSKGRIGIESKDDYKKHSNGKSPDKADAVMLLYAKPGATSISGRTPRGEDQESVVSSKKPVTAGMLRQDF